MGAGYSRRLPSKEITFAVGVAGGGGTEAGEHDKQAPIGITITDSIQSLLYVPNLEAEAGRYMSISLAPTNGNWNEVSDEEGNRS